MTMTTSTADGRLFLGRGALAVAAIAPVSLPTLAMGVATPSRTAWNAALANVAHTGAALEATRAPVNRAEVAYYKLRPERPTFEGVKLEELFHPSRDPAGIIKDLQARDSAIEDDYERREQLVKQQTGYTDAYNAQDRACSASTYALKALMLCPAPDLAAAAYKLELAMAEFMGVEDMAPLLADLRRLSGAAA